MSSTGWLSRFGTLNSRGLQPSQRDLNASLNREEEDLRCAPLREPSVRGSLVPYARTPTPLGRIVFPGMSGSGSGRSQAMPHCESCGNLVSSAVVNYCRDNEALFERSILCVPCQDEFCPDRY